MKRRSVLTSIGFGLLAQIPLVRALRGEPAMAAGSWSGATSESAATPEKPAWQMKADYVEACSCHLFCPCYFNKHAEHPHCEFNMAVKVREGYSGSTSLTGAKYWLSGDLGDEWGTNKKGKWVVVSFDPSTTKEQRDALAPMILKTYGLEWGELKVQEAAIEITRAGDIVDAKLGGGQMAAMKLKREPGADGTGVVLRNVKYFGAQNNTGFELYKSIEHRADLPGHTFSYSDRNAFLISIDTREGDKGGMGAGGQ
ncbi:MAG TPA: DUF1326 domain-containing protein [Verrucomicrobiae bacterium]|jgi:hypothetical protein|nr:DUF1326 domain-containing protein [Verrucomicrobiae bacterium]